MRLEYHVNPIRMGDRYMRNPAWEHLTGASALGDQYSNIYSFNDCATARTNVTRVVMKHLDTWYGGAAIFAVGWILGWLLACWVGGP